MSFTGQKSKQIEVVDTEKLQDLFKGVPDFVIDSLRRKGDQPRRDVGQEFLKLESPVGGSLRGRPCLILAIHWSHPCELDTAGM